MNITYLQYFCAVGKNENITQTAKELHIAQPALSRAIYHLEQEIGVTLFNRKKNVIQLNENGKFFLETCRQILGTLSDTIHQMQENESHYVQTLYIQIRSGGVHFGSMAYEFRKKHPDIQFVILPSEESDQHSCSDNADMMLYTSATCSPGSSQSTLLGKEPLYLTMSRSHPLSKSKSLKLIDMADKNWISADKHNDMFQIQNYFCHLAGFQPHIFVKTEKMNILMNLIALNEGICLFPRLSTRREESTYLTQISISDIKCFRYIHLTLNTRRYQVFLAREFQQFCIDYFKPR